jgi:Zinc knuckle
LNPFNQTYRRPQLFYQHNQQNQGWRQPQYNSSNVPRSMNNQPVPMDLGRTWAPNRGRGRGRGYQANATNAGSSQRNQTNNACFQCGEIGHYARNCPKRQARANLIDFQTGDEQYEAPVMEPDKSTSLGATIRNISFAEKQQLA